MTPDWRNARGPCAIPLSMPILIAFRISPTSLSIQTKNRLRTPDPDLFKQSTAVFNGHWFVIGTATNGDALVVTQDRVFAWAPLDPIPDWVLAWNPGEIDPSDIKEHY